MKTLKQRSWASNIAEYFSGICSSIYEVFTVPANDGPMEIKEGDKVWVSNPYHAMYHKSGVVKRVTEAGFMIGIQGNEYAVEPTDIRNLSDGDGLPGLY